MGRWIWDDMEEASENRVKAVATALLRALQPAIPAAGAATEDEPEVDFALEAALSTLQRMTRQSVG